MSRSVWRALRCGGPRGATGSSLTAVGGGSGRVPEVVRTVRKTQGPARGPATSSRLESPNRGSTSADDFKREESPLENLSVVPIPLVMTMGLQLGGLFLTLAVVAGCGSHAISEEDPRPSSPPRAAEQKPGADAPDSRAAESGPCTPPPVISARRAGKIIRVKWSAPALPRKCGRAVVVVTARSTSVPGPAIPDEDRDRMLARTGNGTATISLDVVDHPPHLAQASIWGPDGRSRVVEAPVRGERGLPQAQVRRIRERREACQGDVSERRTCQVGPPGPMYLRTAELERSLAGYIKNALAWNVKRLTCRPDGRCVARVESMGSYPHEVGMTYRFKSERRAAQCWELVAFSVTRPDPEYSNVGPPVPSRGCLTG